MTIPFYTQAISSLKPGCSWRLVGDDDVNNLEWNIKNTKSRPTQQEIVEEAERLQKEWEDTEYQRLRATEYPDIKEYLDGLVKGDTEQMQAYIDACLAVKAKYPKPGGVE
jgi:tRNA A37 N6-isopentenylltransferase MiaA